MSETTSPDYELNIKKGRKGLWLLVFVIGLKIVLGIALGRTENLIYAVPLILVLLAAIKYYSWNTFALYTGLVIAVFEILDYVIGTIGDIANLSLPFVIVWIGLRVSAFSLIFTALRWKLKQKKAAGNAAGNVAGPEQTTLPDPPPENTTYSDTWTCKNCDQVNPAISLTCKGCGEYK